MRKSFLPYLVAAMSLLSQPVFSQAAEDSTALLGLAGDNLDLYAVLTLFKNSKTIEAFEKSLNDEQTKINNLDLNLDKKIDFIKVVTTKKDSAYSFLLQVDVTKTETQDVAIILLNKDKGKVSLQIVGDEDLYGKDYVIEPKGNSSVTANPGYVGPDPVVVNVPATTTVVVQSAPIVQYVYSPAYVPYYPPYYYGYYPPYFAMATVLAVGIYRHNNYHYHGGYYGGHYHGGNNNVVINNGNRNTINHHNNSRNRSNTVSDNRAKGNYGNGAGASNRAGTNNINNNKAGTNNRAGTNNINNNKAGTNNRATSNDFSSNNNRASTNNRSSTSNFSSSPRSSSTGSGRSMGGGYSGGGSRSGGGGGRRR